MQLFVKERNHERDCGADLGVTMDVKDEKETDGIHVHDGDSGNNNAYSNVSKGHGGTCGGIGQSSSNPNKDVSASGRLE
ncbi:hypothetical protein QN277_019011 [Acacia crassicarpa]|uniref:Uncharacterized protein n=1 Tax=Acacia crassicarpa TaxID=499986 RepID=A0AAE1MS43_9FABA|nr:hypothetical protein QN277_019011 [Acacia crassicarpa]